MKKIYLGKKDVTKDNCPDNWIQMNAYEFAMFVQTPEGAARREGFGQLDAVGTNDAIIFIECGADTARKWRSDKDHHDYLAEAESSSGIATFSLEGMQDDEESEDQGKDLIADEKVNVEADVIAKLELEALRAVIKYLSAVEMELVSKLFYEDKPITENELGKLLGISREEVHALKRRVFRKLRKLLSEK